MNENSRLVGNGDIGYDSDEESTTPYCARCLPQHDEDDESLTGFDPLSIHKATCYGSIDGTITGFGILTSLISSSSSFPLRLLLSITISCCIADSCCMSLGQILSSKQIKRSTGETRKEAKWHLERNMESTKSRLQSSYIGKGVSEYDSKKIVEVLSKYPEVFVDAWVGEGDGDEENEEEGCLNTGISPVILKESYAMFISFSFFSCLPTLIYSLFTFTPYPFTFTTVIMLGIGFGLGMWKSAFFNGDGIRMGVETVGIVGGCGVVAWGLASLIAP
ncbi:hypothetical protein TL16_g10017 [Triparma laevis f. inornata]|uniref:Uncharacterized protein n=2 Tax=Triparma laevis TaxID=1534972 RepID=A0A9W6ZWF7_9STRA|nr:hypothetical protein TrLO_g9931 [Triparma laevis f. longispina]GMH84753.1 hypothetical protein TL16_g10017 [Triparma laevis f. inornata]